MQNTPAPAPHIISTASPLAFTWNLRTDPHLLLTSTDNTASALIRRVTVDNGVQITTLTSTPRDPGPTGTVADAIAALAQVRQEMAARYEKLMSSGSKTTSDFPVLVVHLEEAHQLWDAVTSEMGQKTSDEARDIVSALLRIGRSANIHVVATYAQPKPDILLGTQGFAPEDRANFTLIHATPQGTQLHLDRLSAHEYLLLQGSRGSESSFGGRTS